MPGRPDLPLDETRRLIPANMMWWRIRLAVRLWELIVGAIVESGALEGVPLAVVCPPPPLDGEHVRSNPRGFAARIARSGMTPDHVRLKLWLTQASVLETFSASLPATFLPPPSRFISLDGMLAQEARQEDPTHANPRYGEAVLEQLGALAAARPATIPIAG